MNARRGLWLQVYKVKNIKLEHVQGNPSQAAHMSQIDITQFASAVIFCDYAWMDPDMVRNRPCSCVCVFGLLGWTICCVRLWWTAARSSAR